MNIIHFKDTFDSSHEMRDELQIMLQAQEHGHNVSIATSNYNNDFVKDTRNLLTNDKKYSNKVNIIRRSGVKPPFGNFIPYWAPLGMFKKNQYDIVFVHNIGSFSSFFISIVKFLRQPKIIMKADFGLPTYQHAKRSWLYQKLITWPTRTPDIITCFTAPEKDYLIKLGVPESKITLIPVGINYGKIPDLTASPGSPTGRCTIGLLGRMTEQKGHHIIAEPMKKILNEFPNSKFLVSGSKSDRKYAETFLNEFKKYKQFTYFGFVDDIYDDFLKNCDIILIPSIWESGSIFCLEAMGAGKVVVASDMNPHNEYIKNEQNGFLASEPDDYYRICKSLLKDPSKIRKIGKKARQSVSKYDWQSIGKRAEELYTTLG